jgi:hypothetical protein
MMYYWHKCSEMNDYSYVFIWSYIPP